MAVSVKSYQLTQAFYLHCLYVSVCRGCCEDRPDLSLQLQVAKQCVAHECCDCEISISSHYGCARKESWEFDRALVHIQSKYVCVCMRYTDVISIAVRENLLSEDCNELYRHLLIYLITSLKAKEQVVSCLVFLLPEACCCIAFCKKKKKSACVFWITHRYRKVRFFLLLIVAAIPDLCC